MSDILPEDVMVNILERLPIESLIRFTSVLKRWRSIILSDPNFAKSQFQFASLHHTFRHRVLVSHPSGGQLESHDLAALSFGDPCAVRKIGCPFQRHAGKVSLLCSCNGLLFAELVLFGEFYVWNPSTGFSYQLPQPVGYDEFEDGIDLWGFGYISAFEDYKLIVKYVGDKVMRVFSSNANIWRMTESMFYSSAAKEDLSFDGGEGFLLHEALHWLDTAKGIIAFDLAKEEFRTRMALPDSVDAYEVHNLRAIGDCLCVFDISNFATTGSLDVWVMKEYGVADSWTKLFNLMVSDLPEKVVESWPMLVLETCTILERRTELNDGEELELIRSCHVEKKLGSYVLRGDADEVDLKPYEETLLCLAVPAMEGAEGQVCEVAHLEESYCTLVGFMGFLSALVLLLSFCYHVICYTGTGNQIHWFKK